MTARTTTNSARMAVRSSQFAKLVVLGTEQDDQGRSIYSTPRAVVIGYANSISIRENLGSEIVNVIGTPMPIMIPGYYSASIELEKATIDFRSFKTLAGLNPFVAYDPNIYDTQGDDNPTGLRSFNQDQLMTALQGLEGDGRTNLDTPNVRSLLGGGETGSDYDVPVFTFLLMVYDKIQSDASVPTGIFQCMLQSHDESITVDQALIMSRVSCVGRPLGGSSWFSVLSDIYNVSAGFGYTTDQALRTQVTREAGVGQEASNLA